MTKEQHVSTTGAYTAMRPCNEPARCEYCTAPATLDFIVVECRADKSEHVYEEVSVCDDDLLRTAQYCNDLVRLTASLMFDGLGTTRRDRSVRRAKEYRVMLERITEACERRDIWAEEADAIQNLYKERIRLADEDAARGTSLALDVGLKLEQVMQSITKAVSERRARTSSRGRQTTAKKKRKAPQRKKKR